MRILITIPHYVNPDGPLADAGRVHGSTAGEPNARVDALTNCLDSLRQIFDPNQRLIIVKDKSTRLVNEQLANAIDIVICTTKGRHQLEQLRLAADAYEHLATDAEPLLLGFECQRVLRDRLGDYDYYGYMEDDLVIRDPWFFVKLRWFTDQVGDEALLQPNRYEVASSGLALKAYIDGDLPASVVRPLEHPGDRSTVMSDILGVRVLFERAANPHAGCYFLNARQMAAWSARPDFLDRDTGFVGPLESAATLGIIRTFRVYKPVAENAAFFEIEHYGTGFISQLRRRGDVEQGA
jgi:hypothetical protein